MRTKVSHTKKESLLGVNYLDEDYVLEDFKEGNLKDVLEEISETTMFKIVNPACFKIYSVLDTKDKNNLRIVALDPDFITAKILITPDQNNYFKNGNIGNLPIKSLKVRGITDKQIEEIKRIGFLLRYRDDDNEFILIPSDAFLATLCRQLNMGKLESGIDPLRDIYIASKMRCADEFGIVYRTQKGYGKVFGCFSTKFVSVPQTICYEFMAELAKLDATNVSIRHWKITHFLTTVQFALNGLTEIIGGVKVTPGVRLTLSDVGDASFTLESIICLNGGTILLGDKVSRRHSGDISPADLIAEYSKCLKRIRRVLDDLKKSEETIVEDRNQEILKVLRKIRFDSAFGIRNATSFKKRYDPEEVISCTYLDVLMEILKIPGIIRGEYQRNLEEQVSLCVGNVLSD